MSNVIDMRGRRFGRLEVISRAPDFIQPARKKVAWLCRCDCGIERNFDASNLRTGNTLSCGCLQAELAAARVYLHGHAKREDGKQSTEYMIWSNMRRRCYDEENPAYKHYGGRGITVCARWRNDFAAFFSDMGPRPAGKTIDRKDNNGDYSPINCKWSTWKEQARNTRRNRIIEVRGERKPLCEWSEITGIKRETISDRLERNSPEVAILAWGDRPGIRITLEGLEQP